MKPSHNTPARGEHGQIGFHVQTWSGLEASVPKTHERWLSSSPRISVYNQPDQIVQEAPTSPLSFSHPAMCAFSIKSQTNSCKHGSEGSGKPSRHPQRMLAPLSTEPLVGTDWARISILKVLNRLVLMKTFCWNKRIVLPTTPRMIPNCYQIGRQDTVCVPR